MSEQTWRESAEYRALWDAREAAGESYRRATAAANAARDAWRPTRSWVERGGKAVLDDGDVGLAKLYHAAETEWQARDAALADAMHAVEAFEDAHR